MRGGEGLEKAWARARARDKAKGLAIRDHYA